MKVHDAALVALSTNKIEYMAVAEAGHVASWFVGMVKELNAQQGRVHLKYDSQNAIYFLKNLVYHTRTKHIDMRFHGIRELVSFYKLLLEKVHISKNVANMLKIMLSRISSSINISGCYR